MLLPPMLSTNHVSLDIIRTTPTQYVNGRPVTGSSETFSILCSVQPVLKSTDTRMLPEADRSKACLKLYTKNDDQVLMLREGSDSNPADRFYWEGDLYEVMKVIHYGMGILNHRKAICMRVELTAPIVEEPM